MNASRERYRDMRVLLIYCHPDPQSFAAAIRDTAMGVLTHAGHDVRLVDLYAIGFDPVMSRAERRAYFDRGGNDAAVREHLDHLRWAEALLFIYPTWWYGQPAMLKGWLDRVFVPHVAFSMPEGAGNIRPLLTNIRLVAAISTLGSPRWWWWWMGEPGRRALLNGLAMICHPKCRRLWIALYDMDHVGPAERARFLAKVPRTLARLKI